MSARPCTCHPDDSPPVPCARKYALSDCQATPSITQTTETGQGTLRISLPWPAADLSQNARVHWARKAKATKAARTAAFYLVREVTGRLDWPRVALNVVFHPPTRRRFDRDGLIGRMKAAQDGIADAIGIDDHLFVPTYAMGEPVKGGLVMVALEPARAA